MVFDSILTRRKAKLSPGDLVEIDGRPVRLKVHASARRVSLRLDSAGPGQGATATLTLAAAPMEHALAA